jgi:hypothetical protein
MAILENILGGNSGDQVSSSENSNSFDSQIGTNPQFGTQLSDVLHFTDSSSDSNGGSDSTSFTGIGDASIGFAAPTFIGVSSMNDSSDYSSSQDQSNGGLLGGLV